MPNFGLRALTFKYVALPSGLPTIHPKVKQLHWGPLAWRNCRILKPMRAPRSGRLRRRNNERTCSVGFGGVGVGSKGT